MSDLRELYQQVILDHNKRPRNYRVIDPSSHQADGHNPLCGDQVTIYLDVQDEIIQDITFQGRGCAISTASASLMTDALKGKTLSEAQTIFGMFHQVVTHDDHLSADGAEAEPATAQLGKLAVLTGVRAYPSRVKCATLAWHTMVAALEHNTDPVVTE